MSAFSGFDDGMPDDYDDPKIKAQLAALGFKDDENYLGELDTDEDDPLGGLGDEDDDEALRELMADEDDPEILRMLGMDKKKQDKKVPPPGSTLPPPYGATFVGANANPSPSSSARSALSSLPAGTDDDDLPAAPTVVINAVTTEAPAPVDGGRPHPLSSSSSAAAPRPPKTGRLSVEEEAALLLGSSDDDEEYGEFSFEEVEMYSSAEFLDSLAVLEWWVGELEAKTETLKDQKLHGDAGAGRPVEVDEEDPLKDSEFELEQARWRLSDLNRRISSNTTSRPEYAEQLQARLERDRRLLQFFLTRTVEDSDHAALEKNKTAIAHVQKRISVAETEAKTVCEKLDARTKILVLREYDKRILAYKQGAQRWVKLLQVYKLGWGVQHAKSLHEQARKLEALRDELETAEYKAEIKDVGGIVLLGKTISVSKITSSAENLRRN